MSQIQRLLRNNEVELEQNLQLIRRELLRLLDQSELRECFTCNRLRCSCLKPFDAITTDDKLKKSHEQILAWINASSPDKTDTIWPGTPSIWDDSRIDYAKLLSLKANLQKPTVEAFFKNVGDVRSTPENIPGVLKYMQKHHSNVNSTAMVKYLTGVMKN